MVGDPKPGNRGFRSSIPQQQEAAEARRLQAAVAKVKGDEDKYTSYTLEMSLLTQRMKSRVSALLLTGELTYRVGSYKYLLGSALDLTFTNSLPAGVLSVRLIEINALSATDSILGAWKEGRPLFPGLSLQFKGDGLDADWVPYQPIGGCCGILPCRFALNLVEYPPAASQQARRAQAATAQRTMQQRRPANYHQLSDAAKAAFDGHYYLSSSLRLYDGQSYRGSGQYGIKLTGQSQNQLAAAKSQLCSVLGVQTDWSGWVPLRFRLLQGESSFASSLYRSANVKHRVHLLTPAGDWVDLPFKILPKGGQKRCPTDDLVDVFRELEGHTIPTQQEIPGIFKPMQRSCQRATAADRANMDILARPALRLLFDSDQMTKFFRRVGL